MRSISDTISRLAAARSAIRTHQPAGPDRLMEFAAFGSNPGALVARSYIPPALAAGAPMVVVLHGCTQTAAGYDHGAGWSRLADELGFAVLFPEQQRANNPNLCFNWFNPTDTRRDTGEALSIRQMVAAMIDRHGLDQDRVYVTGLSAGGAMTSVMLATYPDVFAGGAVIAGLPYGTASSVPQAFDRMRAHGGPDADSLGDLVFAASDHAGRWPILSVWHGGSDATVSPINADLVVAQWRTLHGLGASPTSTEQAAGHTRRIWCDAQGRALIEEHRIAGMGHGTPVSGSGPDACGVPGPYMIEAAVSSTRSIAAFWGLDDCGGAAPVKRTAPARRPDQLPAPLDRGRDQPKRAAPSPSVEGPARIIEDALRAAGLMR